MQYIEKPSQAFEFYDLSLLGLIKIRGQDAKKFLQGQLTCHLEKIDSNQNSMGAHCNPQGRVISFFHLFFFNQAYYLLMMKTMIPLAMTALKKYAIFYQVELTDAMDELDIIGFRHNIVSLPSFPFIFLPIPNDPSRFILIAPSPDLKQFIAQHCLSDIKPYSAWHQFNIKQHIPTLYPETSGQCLPHDINLHNLNAIHFDKGCYTGQEIIARMHYKGKLKKHLYHASIKTPKAPCPGMELQVQKVPRAQRNAMIIDVCWIKDQNSRSYEILIVADEITAKNGTLFLELNNDFHPIHMESL